MILISEIIGKNFINNEHRIECKNYPHVYINALVKTITGIVLIFFNDKHVALCDLRNDEFPNIRNIIYVHELIPNFQGTPEAAFTYGNSTYILNVKMRLYQKLYALFLLLN